MGRFITKLTHMYYTYTKAVSHLSVLVMVAFLFLTTAMNAQEFVNPLVIPPLIDSDDTDYHLIAKETMHNFNPMGTDSLNVMVPAFAFVDGENQNANTILGPTIKWDYLTNLTPQVTNDLNEITSCHWYGAHVPQYANGGPHQLILPGDTWNIAFPVLDKPSTMWYHPNAIGLTNRHVQMGLSGMLYVEDPTDDGTLSFIHQILPTEYGVDDIPLIVQTKKFMRNDADEIVIQAEEGYKKDYAYLVNGHVDPVLQVPADMMRLRVLNGDGKFSYNFGIASNPNGSGEETFHLIATDAGYMQESSSRTKLLMSPGERYEWLLDLRGREGDVLYLYNYVADMPDGVIGNATTTENYAQNRALLKIEVGPSTQSSSPIIGFPIPLYADPYRPQLWQVGNTRIKELRKDPFMIDGAIQELFNIDSTLMDPTFINDVVGLDSTEIWTIKNTTNIAQPWHINDIQFWVTEIRENGELLDFNDYPQLFGGPKDNILVMPNWELSYIATFYDYGTGIRFDSSYMYHSQILPHQDRGMVGQFVIWNGDTLTSNNDIIDLERDMKVFPNPSSGDVYLEGSSAETSIIHVYNANGSLIRLLQLPPFEGTMRLEVSGLQKGMLILDWRSVEGRAIKRVITH